MERTTKFATDCATAVDYRYTNQQRRASVTLITCERTLHANQFNTMKAIALRVLLHTLAVL